MKSEENIISVSELTKMYKQFTAVDSISFEVKRGEIFAFLGPNGAGKTTTIKMLTTLLTPSKGEITINGFNTLKQQDNVRRSIGIVFQDPSLDDDLTVMENMQLHAAMYHIPNKSVLPRIEDLLKLVELYDRKDSLVKTFSGGMKRRLEIARALVHHPTILFLDEPTIGLDPQTRNHLWSYITHINKDEGMTVFLTTHYMEEADKIADRISIIDHGKIIADGTSEKLKKQTKTTSLEDAFLTLTGHDIRAEEANDNDKMKEMGFMRGR